MIGLRRRGTRAFGRIGCWVAIAGALAWDPGAAQSRSAARYASNTLRNELLSRPARLLVAEVPLVKALERLADISGARLVFSPTLLAGYARLVSCVCESVSVGEALDRLLDERLFRSAVLEDGYIVIVPRVEARLQLAAGEAAAAPPPKEMEMRMKAKLPVLLAIPTMLTIAPLAKAQQGDRGTVAGKVTNAEAGQPLDGARVSLLNTAINAATDAAGAYRLVNVRPGQYTMVVTRIGYARQTASVAVRAGETATLDVALSPSSVRLGDIVVSAEKEEQKIQEVPYSVSVISTEQIAAAKIDKPSDLTGFVPNLLQSFVGTAGYNFVSLRGINNASGGPYENAVATYVDGVYVYDPAGLDIAFGEVERIEVLRGPQGTLYGRGAMGGVINIITKGPSNTRRGMLSAEYGKFGAGRFVGNFSTPLVKDKLFVSGEGVFFRRSGIFFNKATNADFDRDREFGINARLKWVPSNRLSLALNGRANLTNMLGTYALAANVADAFAKPYQVDIGPGKNEDRRKVYGYSFEAKYFGSKVEVTSTTGYNRVYRGTGPNGIDVDFTALNLLSSTYGQPGWTENGYVNKAISEEFRIGSRKAAGSALSWTVGGYFFAQRNPGKFDVFIGAPLSPFQANMHSLGEVRQRADGTAFFGQATYTINDQVDLTFGLRRDDQTNKYYGKTDLKVDNGPSFPGEPINKQQKSGAWSPKASISYRPNDRVTVFGLFSRGYRAGGVNPAAVTNVAATNYKAEFTSNFEVGAKLASKDERVRANLTAFYIKWTDGQVNTYDFTTFTGVTLNTGKATSQGVELEFSAVPAKNLLVDWNLGVIDAEYNVLNLSIDPNNPLNLNGNKLVYTPSFTSTPAIQYDLPIGKAGNQLSVRGEWRLIGKHYFDLENKISQKSYSVVNARAALQLRDWEIAVWSKNLNDARYLSYGTSFGGTFVLLAYPRTFGVTVTTRLWQ